MRSSMFHISLLYGRSLFWFIKWLSCLIRLVTLLTTSNFICYRIWLDWKGMILLSFYPQWEKSMPSYLVFLNGIPYALIIVAYHYLQTTVQSFWNRVLTTWFHNFNQNCVFKTRFHLCLVHIVCNYHHSSLCAVFSATTYHIWSGGTDWCIMNLTLLKFLKVLISEVCLASLNLKRVIVMGSWWYLKSCRNIKVLSRKWFDSKKAIEKFRWTLSIYVDKEIIMNINIFENSAMYFECERL